MSMVIEGYSCLGSFGDAADIATALRRGSSAPALHDLDLSGLSRFFAPRALRQCDRFSRLALLGASLALENAGLSRETLHKSGIVLASGYGSATPTFEFLDSVMNFGESMASPLAFSLSVHNIPAASIAKTMQIEGPCATVCQFDSAVASGLLLAQSWLAEGRVERVLFGAVDENTAVLESITARLRHERATHQHRACRRPLALSEGTAFFVLRGENARGLGRMESVRLEYAPEGMSPLPHDGIPRFVCGALPHPAEEGTYDGNRAFGNVPIALALNCAAALSLLHEGQRAHCLNYGGGMESAVLITRG